jgi:hypothetical protein
MQIEHPQFVKKQMLFFFFFFFFVYVNSAPTIREETNVYQYLFCIIMLIQHPEFVNGGNYPNDIAMLRLEKAVDVTGFRIRHACLPSRDQPFLADSQCWIMGWGETKGLNSLFPVFNPPLNISKTL